MSDVISPASNKAFFNQWIQGSTNAIALYLRAVSAYPFIDNWDAKIAPNTAMFLVASVLYYKTGRRPSVDDVMTHVCGEFLAPYVDEKSIMGINAAETLMNAARDYISQEKRYMEFMTESPQTIDDLVKKIVAAGYLKEEYTKLGLGSNYDATAMLEKYKGLNKGQKPYTYSALCGVFLNNAYRTGGYTLILHSLASMAKRGSSSATFVTKLEAQIEAETGKHMTIRPDVLMKFYQFYGHTITDKNAKKLFEDWAGLVNPQLALRLSLILSQVAGSGLTAYITIVEAFNSYDDFPWESAMALLEQDFCFFHHALEAVGDNLYYGFKRDLGPARSTLYKNLAWLAKELLIQVSQKTTLNGYKGWTRYPKHETELQALINTYTKNKKPDVTVLTPKQKDDLKKLLEGAAKINTGSDTVCTWDSAKKQSEPPTDKPKPPSAPQSSPSTKGQSDLKG